ncbi:MAG: DUF4230 domain-containing protein [Acidobacteriaceae bacterium]|nr:DUF4230 domain-containing protein [Acidobacteriaceae bacterium]
MSRPLEQRVAAEMKWKIAAGISIVAFLLLLIGVFVYARFTEAFGLRHLDSTAVVTQVKQLNQLVTVRYSIQRVVGLTEPKVPLGEESILLMVEGEALAGVDLSGLTPRDVSRAGKRAVVITLPPAKLFNAFLNEKQTKVWDRHITWWTPWVPYDPDLEHKARLQGISDLRKAALDMGILDQAQKNAESSIRELLSAFDIKATFKTRPLD